MVEALIKIKIKPINLNKVIQAKIIMLMELNKLINPNKVMLLKIIMLMELNKPINHNKVMLLKIKMLMELNKPINHNKVMMLKMIMLMELNQLTILRTQMDNAQIHLPANLDNVNFLNIDCSSYGYC